MKSVFDNADNGPCLKLSGELMIRNAKNLVVQSEIANRAGCNFHHNKKYIRMDFTDD